MRLRSRLSSAWRVLVRGSGAPEPFNKIPILGGSASGSDLDRPFEQSPWVLRAIKRIAEPISAVGLDVYETGQDEPIEDPRLDAFLEAPVLGAGLRRIDISDVLEAATGWLKLEGEFFLIHTEAPVPFPDARRAFAPVIMAAPSAMMEITDGVELLGWRYRDREGRVETLLPEQVVQVAFWNPYNSFRGLSEFEAARLAAEGDRAAAAFARSLNEANGDAGAFVIAKGGVDDAQRKQIEAQLREARELARRGIYRTKFLTGDISVEDPKVRAPDANFTSQRLQNRHEVAIAFGVPPSMFDLAASYSIGSASDQYVLIVNTCMPTARKINAGLGAVLSSLLGCRVRVRSDWDEHPVMQAVRRERIDSAVKLWGMGVPLATAGEYLDMGLPEDIPGADTGYLPFSVSPISAPELPPETNPALAEPGSDDGGQMTEDTTAEDSTAAITARIALALRSQHPSGCGPTGPQPASPASRGAGSREIAGAVCECACALADGDPSPSLVARAPRAASLWREHMLQRRKTVRDYQAKVQAVLMDARRETLVLIAASDVSRSRVLSPSSLSSRAAAADLTFDRARFRAALLARLRNAARAALQAAGEQIVSEIGRDDPWATPPEEVLLFLRQRENKLSGAADTIWEKVRAEIDAGLSAGESTADLASRVKSAFNGIADDRAQTIAQTETAAAYGFGRHEAMRTAGVRFKAWITSGNDNVRAAHRQAGLDYPPERAIPLGDPFVVGDETLQHPGDPQGTPGNTINCHCVAIAVAAPEEPPAQ